MDMLRSTLRLCGANVIDLGMVPTPTVQLEVEHWSARGGIVVTASHNPAEWNGLKFLNSDGVFLDADEHAEFHRLVEENDAKWVDHAALGTRRVVSDALKRHVERVLATAPIDISSIRAHNFHVVVDAVNASGSEIVPALLREMGCTVVPLACDGSGMFPHPPEPLPIHLAMLGEAVRKHSADLGIAVDPDADRLVLYDERGLPFGEEYTIVSAVQSVLISMPDASEAQVVVNLSTTRAVDELCARFGAIVSRAPVGEINVVKAMQETGAVVGGEGSGGVILPAVHAGRDALVGIALVLHALARHGGTASLFRAGMPEWVIRKSAYAILGLDASEILERVASEYASARIDVRDGVRLDLEYGWAHLRVSNTEPLLRIIAEARTEEEADALLARVANAALGDHGVAG